MMKNIFITGIDKGIGLALAEKFLDQGHFVFGTVLTKKPNLPLENLQIFTLDLSSTESVGNCSREILAASKKIDIFINNAGVLIDKEEEGVVIEKLRQTLEVNLIGTIDITEKLLSAINTDGHIINISSSAGSLTLTGSGTSHYPGHYPAYKISKTALNMYTRTLAERLKDWGIIVSAVNPGWVKTDMGTERANLEPQEVATNIFNFALSKPETGHFWFKAEKMPW